MVEGEGRVLARVVRRRVRDLDGPAVPRLARIEQVAVRAVVETDVRLAEIVERERAELADVAGGGHGLRRPGSARPRGVAQVAARLVVVGDSRLAGWRQRNRRSDADEVRRGGIDVLDHPRATGFVRVEELAVGRILVADVRRAG